MHYFVIIVDDFLNLLINLKSSLQCPEKKCKKKKFPLDITFWMNQSFESSTVFKTFKISSKVGRFSGSSDKQTKIKSLKVTGHQGGTFGFKFLKKKKILNDWF